jgi:hypothetical protein
VPAVQLVPVRRILMPVLVRVSVPSAALLTLGTAQMV